MRTGMALLLGCVAAGVAGYGLYRAGQRSGAGLGPPGPAGGAQEAARVPDPSRGEPPGREAEGPRRASGPANALPAAETDDGARVWARARMASPRASERLEAVRVFGAAGVGALADLSDLVTDPDATVCREAFRQWRRIVAAIPDDERRGRIVQAGMSVLDEPQPLDELAAMLAELPLQQAVRSLGQVILKREQYPIAARMAEGRYQRLTGRPYTTRAEAERWLEERAGQPERAGPRTR